MLSRVEVRIETAAGVLNDFVFTEPTGRFVFRDVSMDPDDLHYIVVEADGFRPYRERLDYHMDSRRSGIMNIFLEPEGKANTANTNGSADVVDLSQLTADIPGDARDDFAAALDDIDAGEFEDAIQRLEHAVELAPDYFEALDALGAEYLRAGRLSEAGDVLEKANALSPASARPLLSLGTLRYLQAEEHYRGESYSEAAALFQEAVELLRQSIRRDPNVAKAHHNLGATQYRLEQYADSEASLKTALDLDAGHDDARLALINVYTRQYRYTDALEQVSTYLDRHPEGPASEALERLRGQIEAAIAP
jgi:tetratricopeptide (TPR) repeat protein